MTPEEFRTHAHQMVDWMADYLATVEARPVRAQVVPGEVLSREELIRLTSASGDGRAVDVQVTRLRRKIEQDPKLPRYLQTVRGKGYVLRPD